MADLDAEQPQAGSPSAPLAGDPPSPADDPDTISPAEARKLRREAQSLRARLTAKEQAELSELERARAEAETLRTEVSTLRAQTRRHVLAAMLGNAGARYPDLLVAHIDPATLEWEDDGRPKHAKALLERLRADYPDLFRTPSADGGAGMAAAGAPIDMNTRIRQMAGRG